MFDDAAARRRLEAATFPAIAAELARGIVSAWARCQPVCVVDMPLLFESGAYVLCRPRVLVACSPRVQLERLMRRDAMQRAAAEARVAAQMPLEAKRRLADAVIDNDGSPQQLAAQVERLAAALRRRAWLHRWLLSPAGVLAAAAAAALWHWRPG